MTSLPILFWFTKFLVGILKPVSLVTTTTFMRFHGPEVIITSYQRHLMVQQGIY